MWSFLSAIIGSFAWDPVPVAFIFPAVEVTSTSPYAFFCYNPWAKGSFLRGIEGMLEGQLVNKALSSVSSS